MVTKTGALKALRREAYRLDSHDHSWFLRYAPVPDLKSVRLTERKFNGRPATLKYEVQWYTGNPGAYWRSSAHETIGDAVEQIHKVAPESERLYALED